ncbi:hypothetical protein KM043_014016 [Ampulex compressa]|nr:hypothetical protein KM043_014016 [Ampulex compressa]
MNLFEEWTYYRPTQLLLSLVGLWPYLNRKTMYGLRVGMIIVSLSFVASQIANIISSKYNLEVIIEEVPLVLTGLLCCVKYLGFCLNGDVIRVLFDNMSHDWNTLMVGDEGRLI